MRLYFVGLVVNAGLFFQCDSIVLSPKPILFIQRVYIKTARVYSHTPSPMSSSSAPVDLSLVLFPAPLDPLQTLAAVACAAVRAFPPSAVLLRPFNPALLPNGDRPVVDDDRYGFGPTKRIAGKKALGDESWAKPYCDDESHETYCPRVRQFRTKCGCRGCLKEAAERIPDTATRFQEASHLHALTKGQFCVFCMLEVGKEGAHSVLHTISCEKHEIAIGYNRCDAHNLHWHFCKQCNFDPRAGTAYCACGVLLRYRKKHCKCATDPREVSYGIRYNINPFVVPTDEVRAQQEKWAADSLERAMVMQNCADVLRDGIPGKRKAGPNAFGGKGHRRVLPRV